MDRPDPAPISRLAARAAGPAFDDLLDQDRRLREEETCLLTALTASRAELEDAMRAGWLHCVSGQIVPADVRARCGKLQETVDQLERRLVRARIGRREIADELRAHRGARDSA